MKITNWSPTRYREIGYYNHTKNHWQFVDTSDRINFGPVYQTKVEMLADLDRFYRDRFLPNTMTYSDKDVKNLILVAKNVANQIWSDATQGQAFWINQLEAALMPFNK